MAYVGTFNSPLRDVLPTQVDLPPGNGRGIHPATLAIPCRAMRNRSQVTPAEGQFIVEIKAGQTISSDWAANSQTVAQLFAKMKQAVSAAVVYGGMEEQERNGVTCLPWHAIQDYSWVE
jgi:hypothetical protein